MIQIPLQIIDLEDDGFHPLVEVVVFGKPHTVVLDTGASRTAFDKSILLEANNEATFKDSGKLSTGLGTNAMVSSTLILHDLHIGTLHIPDFEVAVLDLSSINHAYSQLNLPTILGVLGGDVLMKYKAVIDYGKSTLILNSRI